MAIPTLALSFAYWLHMIATVTWIGGLAAVAILLLPAAREALDPPGYAALLGRVQRRLDPVAWFSLMLLLGTGMFQMSASPHYQGILAIEGTWALAIFVKHLVFIGMAGLSAYMTWGVLPDLRRMALRRVQEQGAGQIAAQMERLHRKEVLLLRLNLFLGVIVLALTALARAA